jgi:CBS domain-containing protein
VDKGGGLLGVIIRSDLLEHWISALVGGPVTGGADLLGMRATIAYDLIGRSAVTASPRESCRLAAERMAREGVKRLPVVAPEEPGRLLGLVTLGDLLKARRRLIEEEAKRERFLGPGRVSTQPRSS